MKNYSPFSPRLLTGQVQNMFKRLHFLFNFVSNLQKVIEAPLFHSLAVTIRVAISLTYFIVLAPAIAT